MRALRFEDGKLRVTEVAAPNRAGEALVRVTLAGICNTDLEITRGYTNFSGTLGHEFVGVVEASPDRAQIGRRVVGEINIGCGDCEWCRAGDARQCLTRKVPGIHHRDGAFADYLNLPPQNLRFVPDAVNDRQAVFTEPLAAACQILEQVEIRRTHRVAVIGDGKLGQLIARVLATTGSDLLLIGKHADKLELAAKAGIKTVDLRELKIDPAARFDFVVEASGSAGGLKLAVDLVRPRGVIVLKSTFSGAVEFEAWRIVVNEITVIGSRCGRFENALKLLEEGRVQVEDLIAGEFNLSEGLAAITAAQKKGALKILLKADE
ncbi:MAG TPA: alcohol dehydrogenase catalytic domain-containing protein [Blastocatellia bacterium]|nr:alcohol dehydrogenase catalytic domain-containing protein [Blastocatellia bacterium]HMZ16630.1 alcohol dehydrogenase catalytic domain-containing protein [Blastocatellia bacterium]HNG32069.1 alcohol dehydrogenase catalytic domain-containing protein [Blastocatellia bacterium]